jgi:sec-independent protein translocase protein TatC
VTPPDVVSQFLLAVPLCVLYEVGILVARGVKPAARTKLTPRQMPRPKICTD